MKFKESEFSPDINCYQTTTVAGNCSPVEHPTHYFYKLQVNTHYEGFTAAMFAAMEQAAGDVAREWLQAYWESEEDHSPHLLIDRTI